MKTTLLLISALLLSVVLPAQTKTGRISGSIVTADKKPLESATIQLLKADNKSLVKSSITDKSGNFSFEKLAEGKYIIITTAVGFAKKTSEPVEITASKQEVDLASIEVSNQQKAMGE